MNEKRVARYLDRLEHMRDIIPCLEGFIQVMGSWLEERLQSM